MKIMFENENITKITPFVLVNPPPLIGVEACD